MGWKASYLRAVNALRGLVPHGRLERWQDPRVVYENAEEHHAPLRLLGARDDAFAAVSAERGETRWVRFLAHREAPQPCKFRLYPNPASCPVNEATAGDQAFFEDWDSSVIPSNWQLQRPDEDPPIYTNIVFPWKQAWPLSTAVPRLDNPTGCYRLEFDLAEEWLEAVQSGARDVFLILHGAGAGVDIYVNGARVGYGQDSMTETEVNISGAALKASGNSLTMVVYRWTDGSYMEDQDQWWLSGVFREVELSCRPTSGGVADYFVESELTDAGAGTVTAFVRLNGGAKSIGTEVRAVLFDADKRKVAEATSSATETSKFGHEVRRETVSVAKLALAVPAAQRWSVQRPYLYTLVIESVDGSSGEPAQIEATRVGMRTVRIENGQVLVNGEAILVCGVNRHEWDPKLGKALREESMVRDIKLMKQFNFNAVRNSHYPNAHRWYELCDEYGLFVIDEANIETHGFAKVVHLSLLQNDWRWKKAFLSRVKAMVRRSRNHPCIIGWSLGNESGSGDNSRACARWVREVDPTRTLQYEGGIRSGDSPLMMGDGRDPVCTDIICPMYDSPQLLAKISATTTAKSGLNRERPLITCEYAHAMGNSSGNLHLYWNLFRSAAHPKIQGGFIWDWVDQGLSLDGFLDGEWGYGGDFGPTSGAEDKTFCINGMVFPDRTPHPAMFEAKFLQRPIGLAMRDSKGGADSDLRLDMEVFAHAPAMDLVDFEFQLFSTGKTSPLATGTGRLAGPLGDMDVRAGRRSGELVLDGARAQAQVVQAKWLVVRTKLGRATSWAPKGHVMSEESFELDTEAIVALRKTIEQSKREHARADDKVLVSMPSDIAGDKRVVRVQGRTYVAEMDLESGRLVAFEARNGSGSLLEAGGLQHCFYRAPTDNDLGGLDSMLPNQFAKHFINQQQRSFQGQWQRIGLDALVPAVIEVVADKCEPAAEGVELSKFHVRVMESHRGLGVERFRTGTNFKFIAEKVTVEVKVRAAKSTVQGALSLPRIGMQLLVPGDLDQVEYLGCGPHECYPDRKASGRVGLHSAQVDEMHTPYIKPSESGGRADVQWVRVRSRVQPSRALKVQHLTPEACAVRPEFFDGMDLSANEPQAADRTSGAQGAQICLSRYSVDMLSKVRHQRDLPAVGAHSPIYLHVDTAHMGLGGDVSWQPKLHEQYRVRAEDWHYALELSVE